MRHTVTIENIDAKLLFEQKCDLLDLIGFLEELYENYDNYAFPKKKIFWAMSCNLRNEGLNSGKFFVTMSILAE